jgi:hypothetical protein
MKPSNAAATGLSMTALNSYSTGTVSVNDGDTTIVGASTIWSDINARGGDVIFVDGAADPIEIKDVTDTSHLTLWTPWSGGAKSNVSYVIVQKSPLRFAGGQAMADVAAMVAALDADGFYVFVASTLTAPDPSLGEEGQYAFQPSTKKLWFKESGIWNFLGVFSAFGTPAPYDSGTTYKLFDVATSGGSSYVWINATPGSGHAPPDATYWAVLASKGDKGDKGDTGPAGGINAVRVTKFTSNGTYTPDPNLIVAKIECQGSGGAGGSCAASATNDINGAGGGGSGAYALKWATKSNIGASQTVTVGAAGAAAAAGQNKGGNGNSSSVGTLCVASGGGGGIGAPSADRGGGGAGGSTGTGDVVINGKKGAAGFFLQGSTLLNAFLAAGGGADSARFGGGAAATIANSAGNAATSYGGGGSGASDYNAGGAKAGGAGFQGIVIVTEFCSS